MSDKEITYWQKYVDACEQRDDLAKALSNVMHWISNWDVAFDDDDEWKLDRDAAYAALNATLTRKTRPADVVNLEGDALDTIKGGE